MAHERGADFDLIARNFEQAAATYEQEALVQNAMGSELIAVLARTLKEQGQDLGALTGLSALEIGCGPGNFTQLLLTSVPGLKRLVLNDLSSRLVEQAKIRVSAQGSCCALETYVGNLATAAAPDFAPCDLIISNATLQWLSDLDAALSRFQALARPHGLLVYSSFLEGTFAELTELLGHSLNYLSADAARACLERHCEVLHFCTKTVVQHFDTSFHLLRHFRDTGVNSLRSEPLSVGQMRRLMLRYEQRYSDAYGAIPLTWQPYFVVARWRSGSCRGRQH